MSHPTDDLVRAIMPGGEFRATDDDESLGMLHGHFAVFGQWTEIHSWFEGDFLERIERGAFAKTIRENRDTVKVLYDHGHDFQVGNKVLGPIEELSEDSYGAAYEVPLFDTTYNRDLLPGLKAGSYGASFRFRVIKDAWDDEPGVSAHNPTGLPERTITEVRLFEFGPVTFPAYEGASAGVRSLTDHYRELRGLSPRTPSDDGAADTATGAGVTGHHSRGLLANERSRALDLLEVSR